ncbi:MAG: hypothetical protein PHP08_00425 [Candidatus Dojkabacteria bacterium]|nr:hypothetical protein [Candidatus Dojkabacteria bacterium]
MQAYGRSAKPDYTSYVEYLESLGWRRSQIVLDEKNTRIVTLTGGPVGNTTAVIDVRCPAGQKMSIMGTQQVPAGQDFNTAHALRVRLAGTTDQEISPLTKIRITKEKTTEDLVQLARPFYQDVSITKQRIAAVGTQLGHQFKTSSEYYRFTQGIELNGEEHWFLYVVGESPTGGPILPDIQIDTTHIKFALEVDLWTS